MAVISMRIRITMIVILFVTTLIMISFHSSVCLLEQRKVTDSLWGCDLGFLSFFLLPEGLWFPRQKMPSLSLRGKTALAVFNISLNLENTFSLIVWMQQKREKWEWKGRKKTKHVPRNWLYLMAPNAKRCHISLLPPLSNHAHCLQTPPTSHQLLVSVPGICFVCLFVCVFY